MKHKMNTRQSKLVSHTKRITWKQNWCRAPEAIAVPATPPQIPNVLHIHLFVPSISNSLANCLRLLNLRSSSPFLIMASGYHSAKSTAHHCSNPQKRNVSFKKVSLYQRQNYEQPLDRLQFPMLVCLTSHNGPVFRPLQT